METKKNFKIVTIALYLVLEENKNYFPGWN